MACRDSQTCELVAETQFGQFADRGWLQVHSGTDRTRVDNCFIDADVNSRLVQTEREAKAGDAAADDDDVQDFSSRGSIEEEAGRLNG